MPKTEEFTETITDGKGLIADDEQWPGIDSRYRLIIVAAQRAKQLQRGARARIEADPRRRRNTSIAIEEVKQGRINFTNNVEAQKNNGNGSKQDR
ncbi:MAG: DNA-directed RNA polymerase subunit omega [Acidobacteriota bacterium]|nr:DNA-directed RNA polymerase subunit omega [Acidobacteriota bacterium]